LIITSTACEHNPPVWTCADGTWTFPSHHHFTIPQTHRTISSGNCTFYNETLHILGWNTYRNLL